MERKSTETIRTKFRLIKKRGAGDGNGIGMTIIGGKWKRSYKPSCKLTMRRKNLKIMGKGLNLLVDEQSQSVVT